MNSTLSPEMFQFMQSLSALQGMPGVGAAPGMAQSVIAPGGPLVAGPPAPAANPADSTMPGQPQSFPWNATALAALGAAGMGLRAGQRTPLAAGSAHVTTRAPGGFNPTYNRLPGRG